MHWEGLVKVSQAGKDVPIDNLKSKATEVNWMMEPVWFQEMFTIVKGLKRGKASGPYSIINEVLKYGGNRMVEVLCSLVNLVMESRYWPDGWRRSYIVPHFKAVDEEVADNYRGINLGNCVGKVMTRVQVGSVSFQIIIF